MSDLLPRRDVTFTPKPEDRRPCPHCQQPGESVVYKGAVVSQMDISRDPAGIGVSMRITDVLTAQWVPCCHEFDGKTGLLIGRTSE